MLLRAFRVVFLAVLIVKASATPVAPGWIFQVGNSAEQQARSIIVHNGRLHGVGYGFGRPDRQMGVSSGSYNGDSQGQSETSLPSFYYFQLPLDGVSMPTPTTSGSDYTPTDANSYIYADYDESCTYAWRYYRAKADCIMTTSSNSVCATNSPADCPGSDVTASCSSSQRFCVCNRGESGTCTLRGPAAWGDESVPNDGNPSSAWKLRDERGQAVVNGVTKTTICNVQSFTPTTSPNEGTPIGGAGTWSCSYCEDTGSECERNIMRWITFSSDKFRCTCRNKYYRRNRYGWYYSITVSPVTTHYHGQYLHSTGSGGTGSFQDGWSSHSSWKSGWWQVEGNVHGNSLGNRDYCSSRGMAGSYYDQEEYYSGWGYWSYDHRYYWGGHSSPKSTRDCTAHPPLNSAVEFYACSQTNFKKSLRTDMDNKCTGTDHRASYAKDGQYSFYHSPFTGKANSLAPYQETGVDKMVYGGGIQRCFYTPYANRNYGADVCNHRVSEDSLRNSLQGHDICDSVVPTLTSERNTFCFKRSHGLDRYQPIPPQTSSSLNPVTNIWTDQSSVTTASTKTTYPTFGDADGKTDHTDSMDAAIWAKNLGYAEARVTTHNTISPTRNLGGHETEDEILAIATDDQGVYMVGQTKWDIDAGTGAFLNVNLGGGYDVSCVDPAINEVLYFNGANSASSAAYDILIAYEPLGTNGNTGPAAWRCVTGSNGDDKATSVAVDASFFYVGGYVQPSGINAGSKKAFLMKYTKTNPPVVQWAENIESTDNKDQSIWDIVISGDGNHLYVYGMVKDSSISLAVPRGQNNDLVVEKRTASDGKRVWAIQRGLGGDDQPAPEGSRRMAVDETNGFIWGIARSNSWFDSRRPIDDAETDPHLKVSTYRPVIWRMKIDGTDFESGQYGNPQSINYPGLVSIAVDDDGYAYVAGAIEWILGSDPQDLLDNKDLIVFRLPYCAGGSYNKDWSSCVTCSAGTYQPYDGSPTNYCIPCPEGTYSNSTGLQTCTPCPKGYYQPNIGQTSCIPCARGTVSPIVESARCIPCAQGTVMNSTAEAFCDRCAANQYQDEEGAFVCKDCPGVSTSPKASTSIDDCKCSEGTYSGGASVGLCFDCPEFASCPRGITWPSADPGYWLDPKIDPDWVHLCFPFDACRDGGTDNCADGYNAVGTYYYKGNAIEDSYACLFCDDDHYRDRGWCKKCPEDPMAWILAYVLGAASLVFLAPIILIAGWCVVRKHKHREEIYLRLKAVTRIIESQISFWSFMALLGLMDLRNLPESWNTLFGVWSIFNLNLNYYVGAECQKELLPAWWMRHYSFWWQVRFGIPFLLIFLWIPLAGVVATIHGITNTMSPILDTPERKKRHRMGKNPPCFVTCPRRFIFNVFQGSLQVINFLFFPSHLIAMEVFRCAQMSPGTNEYLLAADPSIHCFHMNGSWGGLMPFAIVATVFFTFSMFVLMNTIIASNFNKRWRRRMFNARMFGFLWDKYEEKWYWWESVQLLRKLLVGFVLLLHYRNSTIEIFFLFTINLVYTISQVYVSPYVSNRLDMMEVFNLFALLLLSVIMLMFHGNRVSSEFMYFCEALSWLTMWIQLFVPVIFTLLILIRGRQGVDPLEEIKKRQAEEKAKQELLSDQDVNTENNPFG